MMTVEQLEKVEAEMDRLMDRIISLTSAHEVYVEKPELRGPHESDPLRGGQYTAAVKRASLDLARELAELRKP